MNILEQNNYKSPDEFYQVLKERLEATHDFPEKYLFKFIIPNDHPKLLEIYRIFDGLEYTTHNRDSKNGKYVAVNLNAFVLDADQVVAIYRKVEKIEGVLML